MKFKADRATLMKSLAHVQNVVEKRNTIPILANVLLAVRDGKLTIAATDLEIALVENQPVGLEPRQIEDANALEGAHEAAYTAARPLPGRRRISHQG